MSQISKRAIVMLFVVLGLPSGLHAQEAAAIAGTVRDTSGAVLPGVTVEARSPALIEGVRSVVSDGSGQYRVVNLRPGTYTVTFSLPGFNTVVREGIELTGTFTATVNVDMRVGALEETITVTGETPTVDLQSATQQRVMNREVLDAIPAYRDPNAIAALVPGVKMTGTHDVGGASQASGARNATIHGSSTNSQVIMEDGVSLAAMVVAWGSQLSANMSAAQEIAVDTGAVSIDQAQGGLRINIIPREGGNRFTGTLVVNGANSSMQGSNLTQDLRDRGLRTPDSIGSLWDINPAFGGPIKQDKLWFFASGRYWGSKTYVANVFYDRNANNPNAWFYDPDFGRPAYNFSDAKDVRLRFTWQVSPRNKLNLGWIEQVACNCPTTVDAAAQSVEASRKHHFPVQRQPIVTWRSPVTNRLLLESAVSHKFERASHDKPSTLDPRMISVVEQSTGFMYRARDSYRSHFGPLVTYRAAVSYVTGAHTAKIGMNDTIGRYNDHQFDNQPVSYRFNNGVPNLITMRAMPFTLKVNVDHELGIFAQDVWTAGRMTLTTGLRYDYDATSFPEQRFGPVPLAPTLSLAFPAQDNLAWHDLSPRLAVVYDLFGTGKTAVKASLSKYLDIERGASGLSRLPNPILKLVTQTTRSWNDADRDYTPDCDLLNPATNGECGPMANPNFGKRIPGQTFDEDILRGWGKRIYNWEFSTGVQHEVLPRVSVDVGYFRRTFGNLIATDDRTLSPADFDVYSITAPRDPRLPGGGGHVISGLYDLKPASFGQPANEFVTFAKNYGGWTRRWHGVDVGVTARPRGGVLLQGGISTGSMLEDNCAVRAKLPEIPALTTNPYCRTQEPFLAQVKGIASYTIPRVDVQVSGAFQSYPGPEILANFTATNPVVAPGLGRNLSGNRSNVTVNLVSPATMYGERLNQLDLRFGKLFRVGATRTNVSVDIFNTLNNNTVLALNNAFAAWQRPTRILTARFFKLSAQFDF